MNFLYNPPAALGNFKQFSSRPRLVMHKPKKFKKNMTTEEWACHLSEQKIRWAENRKKKTTYKQCFNTQIQIDK